MNLSGFLDSSVRFYYVDGGSPGSIIAIEKDGTETSLSFYSPNQGAFQVWLNGEVERNGQKTKIKAWRTLRRKLDENERPPAGSSKLPVSITYGIDSDTLRGYLLELEQNTARLWITFSPYKTDPAGTDHEMLINLRSPSTYSYGADSRYVKRVKFDPLSFESE